MWNDTLLLFVSDNGGPVYWNNPAVSGSNYSGGAGANNWPLRGGKISFLEGGVRVASFVSGGAISEAARGATIDAFLSIADIWPTFCTLGGANTLDPKAEAAGLPGVDGQSLVALLRGEVNNVRSTLPLAISTDLAGVGEGAALIDGDLKIILGTTLFNYTQAEIWPTEDYDDGWDQEYNFR